MNWLTTLWRGLTVTGASRHLDCIGCRRGHAVEVRQIQGPRFSICEACVVRARDLIQETAAGQMVQAEAGECIGKKCAFCGSDRTKTLGLVAWSRGAICRACIQLCEEILDQDPQKPHGAL